MDVRYSQEFGGSMAFSEVCEWIYTVHNLHRSNPYGKFVVIHDIMTIFVAFCKIFQNKSTLHEIENMNYMGYFFSYIDILT